MQDKKWQIQLNKFSLNDIKSKDLLVIIVLFLIFISSFVWFFSINNSHNIWSTMKVAGGNAFAFCEFNNLKTSLVQRSNTWSNLGFLFVGTFIVLLSFKDFYRKSKSIRINLLIDNPIFSFIMGCSILYLFIGSFLYHASVRYFFQMIDQTGMYAIVFSFTAFHIFRIWPKYKFKSKKSTSKLVVISFFLVNFIFILFFKDVNINILFPIVFIIFTALTFIYNRKHKNIYSKIFINSLYLLLFSFSSWILDREGILCDPNSLFQGHALWHILNSIVLLMIYLYYRSENSVLPNIQQINKNANTLQKH